MSKRKIQVETDNSDWKAPKLRKPRKPMSDEQRAAAAERLAKVRENRKKEDPNYGKSGLHESLRYLPDDAFLNPTKVKKWIKTQKDIIRTESAAVRQKVKGSIAKLASAEGYVRVMQKYLKDGDWVDDFYGEYQEKKIQRRCLAQGYYWYGPKKGQPKFQVGVYYPLLGSVYTQEMFDAERAEDEEHGRNKPRKKRKRNKRAMEEKT